MKAFVQKHKTTILKTAAAVVSVGVVVAVAVVTRKVMDPKLVIAVTETVADKAE